jgi:hypothetical protein
MTQGPEPAIQNGETILHPGTRKQLSGEDIPDKLRPIVFHGSVRRLVTHSHSPNQKIFRSNIVLRKNDSALREVEVGK